MKKELAIIAIVAAAATTANAAFFSFASDTRDRAWTFNGNPGGPIAAGIASAPGPGGLTLHIDDNNGILPRIDVSIRFEAEYSIAHVGSLQVAPGVFSHNYRAQGRYTFVDIAAGVPLLTCEFSGALFTARGGENSWFSTAALQVDDAANGVVNYVWSGANLPGYQLSPGPLLGSPRGFAFDLTAINRSGSIPYDNSLPGVGLNPQTRLPNAEWWSEASYSANAFVPAPGSLALLAAGGLAAGRRRRA